MVWENISNYKKSMFYTFENEYILLWVVLSTDMGMSSDNSNTHNHVCQHG